MAACVAKKGVRGHWQIGTMMALLVAKLDGFHGNKTFHGDINIT